MYQKFFELFKALDKEALRMNESEDEVKFVTLIEDAQSELVDAWTDYMMSQPVPPTDEESAQYHACLRQVSMY